MTVLNNFSGIDEPITEKTAETFLSSYSSEVAQGYLLAIKDILGELDVGLHRNTTGASRSFLPKGQLHENLMTFHWNKKLVVKKLEMLGVQLPQITAPDL